MIGNITSVKNYYKINILTVSVCQTVVPIPCGTLEFPLSEEFPWFYFKLKIFRILKMFKNFQNTIKYRQSVIIL